MITVLQRAPLAKTLASIHLFVFLSTLLFIALSAQRFVQAQPPLTPLKVEIVVSGIEDDLKKNALAYLALKKSLSDPHFSEIWLQKLHKKAPQNIIDALHPFGYYQSTVESTLKRTSQHSWLATYHVTLGEPVLIDKVLIHISEPGKSNPNIIALIANFSLKKGDMLNHSDYEAAKEKLIREIGLLGFSQLKNEQSTVTIDPKKNTAIISIKLLSGEQFQLGTFYFHQNFLHEAFIRSYIQGIKQGDPLSQENLLALHDSLFSSGYFSSVDIQPDFSRSENQQVPIDVNLKAAKRHKFTLGAGYDTEIEGNISFRWQHRRLNRAGHNGDIYSKLSPKKSIVRGSYWIPINDPRTDKISIIAQFETEDTDNTDRDTFDLESGYWFSWKNWTSTLFSEYKYESFYSGDNSKTNTELLSLGLRMEKIQFEKALYPRSGWSLYSELRGSSEAMLSDIDYFRIYLKSRLLLPIADRGRLILRGEFGWAETSDFDSYPSSLRFYAGGDHSIRGYKWKALGPKDKEGNIVGGKNVATGSIEYNHKIAEKWVLAGFVDAGNAYNNSLDKIYTGTGFGVRWIAPFGLVRSDLGFPLTSDEDVDEDNFVFYFGFEVTL